MLLLFRQGSRVVNDKWVSSAGGHFEEFELNDAKACVLRELNEELSITEDMINDLELRYITLRNTNGEVRQNYYFFAKLPDGIKMNLSSNEGILKWFTIDELQNLIMPFTSRKVMDHYIEIGRHTNLLYGGIADNNSITFTELSEF